MPAPFTFQCIASRFLALAVLLAGLSPQPGSAEEPEFYFRPYAPNHWTFGRRLDESRLRYCVDRRDPDWEVAGAIADAVASALLLEPQQYLVDRNFVAEDITKVYALLVERCDMHLGFKLIPGGYAQWATLTRPYYEAEYVFVTNDPDIGSLGDLPPGRPIGATLGTSAHVRLVSYVSALPARDRWPVHPKGTNDLALESLLDGSAAMALVWAPTLWAKQRAEPAFSGLRGIDPRPLPPTALGVGAMMLRDETFLRTAVDEAIAALTADGTISAILEYHRFPATAKR